MKLETHHAPKRAKEWSWSFSKFKNYLTCPKRMYEVDILKKFSDGGGEALLWGNEVHGSLANVLKTGCEVPETMKQYAYWVDRIRRGAGQLLVEQKYAITRDFQPTTYFADNVWYRGIGDVVRIDPPFALVADWKTGKYVDGELEGIQLHLMAQCIFSHFPAITHVRSSYIWLKDECESPELITRAELAVFWGDLLPKVNGMEVAAQNLTYPPKPGNLCKNWCPVTSCPFHGKGSR